MLIVQVFIGSRSPTRAHFRDYTGSKGSRLAVTIMIFNSVAFVCRLLWLVLLLLLFLLLLLLCFRFLLSFRLS